MKFINKDTMEIVGNRKIWFTISAIVMIVCIAFMFINGFNLDTDFAGGISLQYDLHKTMDKAELDNVRELVDSVEGITVTSIQKSGDDSSCVIIKAADVAPEVVNEVYEVLNIAYGAPIAEETEESEDETVEETATPSEIEEESEATPDEATTEAEESEAAPASEESEVAPASEESEVAPASEESEPEAEETPVTEAAPEEIEGEPVEIVYGGTEPVEVLSESRIGASISNEIKRSAFVSTIIAVILMLVYITIRFEFRSAIAAIFCLIHDIVIVIASYSILGIPVSSNIIAVILTILGYSINATIILFDRIRENRRRMGKTDFGVVINTSTRQTLMRSINTNITTLFTIGMIYILGVHSIKEFALPIIIGIVAGLYSSIFLSGSFWYVLTPKHKGN